MGWLAGWRCLCKSACIDQRLALFSNHNCDEINRAHVHVSTHCVHVSANRMDLPPFSRKTLTLPPHGAACHTHYLVGFDHCCIGCWVGILCENVLKRGERGTLFARSITNFGREPKTAT